jgi:hypothetical protein
MGRGAGLEGEPALNSAPDPAPELSMPIRNRWLFDANGHRLADAERARRVDAMYPPLAAEL